MELMKRDEAVTAYTATLTVQVGTQGATTTRATMISPIVTRTAVARSPL
jgi:hypothetical protein